METVLSFGKTCREFDDFTGLHYYRARWYDSNLGRFISEDPIGFAGGDVNLYGYVGNKPVSYSDPFGFDEYTMMERFASQEPLNRTTDEILDDVQFRLAGLGNVPVLGEPWTCSMA
ncbi:MAG: RHS repeat-associated core domain-containing protein [Acidobacteria bacterium]|nr:RHS repeat-associated core domain-containing protein [Acidobacteriota bacterium]